MTARYQHHFQPMADADQRTWPAVRFVFALGLTQFTLPPWQSIDGVCIDFTIRILSAGPELSLFATRFMDTNEVLLTSTGVPSIALNSAGPIFGYNAFDHRSSFKSSSYVISISFLSCCNLKQIE